MVWGFGNSDDGSPNTPKTPSIRRTSSGLDRLKSRARDDFKSYVDYVEQVKNRTDRDVSIKRSAINSFRRNLYRIQKESDLVDKVKDLNRLKTINQSEAQNFIYMMNDKKANLQKQRINSYKEQIEAGNFKEKNLNKIENITLKSRLKKLLKTDADEKRKAKYAEFDRILQIQMTYFMDTGNFRDKKYMENRTHVPMNADIQSELNRLKKRVLLDFFYAYKTARITFLKGYVLYLKRIIYRGESNNAYAKVYQNTMKSFSSKYGSAFLRKYTHAAARRMSPTEKMYRKRIRSLILLVSKKYRR